MRAKKLFWFVMLIMLGNNMAAKTLPENIQLLSLEKQVVLVSVQPEHSDSIKNKKLIAAICAFPFPLGMVGAHRVLLGTKPWVPIVYVATLGGCFGILPLIDFIVIVSTKDPTVYENNPGVFMWVK